MRKNSIHSSGNFFNGKITFGFYFLFCNKSDVKTALEVGSHPGIVTANAYEMALQILLKMIVPVMKQFLPDKFVGFFIPEGISYLQTKSFPGTDPLDPYIL